MYAIPLYPTHNVRGFHYKDKGDQIAHQYSSQKDIAQLPACSFHYWCVVMSDEDQSNESCDEYTHC